jgi:hypothetical protein
MLPYADCAGTAQPKAAPLVRVYEAVHKLKVELDSTSKELDTTSKELVLSLLALLVRKYKY